MDAYRINLISAQKRIYSGHLKLGGISPSGDEIAVNNFFITLNGHPFFGIGGEFHYSRCPSAYWEEELLKLKAAGINTVTTYVFWNHHEEEESVFLWEGDRDVRRFLGLCAKHGLLVLLRIGPFAHGEARNGGLPDWLYGRPFTVRTNDRGYLFHVERLYTQLGKQVSGMMFKDGGPVVGIQLENEHNAASAPWEFLVVNEYEWVHKGSGGAEHIRALKALALKAGLEAPLYTCTGWDGGSYIPDETLPIYGGYCWQPWTVNDGSAHKPSYETIIRDFHEGNFKNSGYTPSSTGGRYPYISGELGGGMACWYKYRFAVAPESVVASAVARVAGGCNFLGLYMFRDGTNPTGRHSYLNERVVPKISYNFQAPIGEYGQLQPSCQMLRPLFLFLSDYADKLCGMATALPASSAGITPEDTDTLRFAARHKDGSGFVFLVNYQDHADMPDRENVRLELTLPGGKLSIPSGKGFILKSGVSAILPFNMDLGGVLLKYATAQYITCIYDGGVSTYFFFTPEGMESEFCLDCASIGSLNACGNGVAADGRGSLHVSVQPGTESVLSIATHCGNKIKICTLTAVQAHRFWVCSLWGRKRAVLSDADIFIKDDCIAATRTGNPEMELSLFPCDGNRLSTQYGEVSGVRQGVFTTWRLKLPEKKVALDVRHVGGAKATVNLPADSLEGLGDIFLRVDYLGSVGNAFIAGRLVADNFCNGQVWEIGLKRFFPEIAEKGMYFHVIPYQKGGDVVFEPGLEFRHEFNDGETAEIFSIEAVPEYQALIRKL
jgi:hypothetical protein